MHDRPPVGSAAEGRAPVGSPVSERAAAPAMVASLLAGIAARPPLRAHRNRARQPVAPGPAAGRAKVRA